MPSTTSRPRASFWAQANALTRKNLCVQRRKWGANICLLSAPFLICTLLYALQNIINNQLNVSNFRCGCQCLSCCDWVPVREAQGSLGYVYECYNSTAERPCSPYASCSAYDNDECGYLYSTADQVAFCEVKQPPLWPALFQVPRRPYRPPKYPEIDPQGIPPPAELPPESAAMLYAGGAIPEVAERLMEAMWARSATITDAATAAYLRAQAAGQEIPTSTENSTIGSEQEFVDAAGSLTRGLYEFGLVMGTSSFTSLTMLMEPAFVATSSGSSEGAASRPPLYFAQPDCRALSPEDANTLASIGEAITNMTGFPVECLSLPPAQASLSLINDQIFCGWLSSGCVVRNGTKYLVPKAVQTSATTPPVQEFIGALYDWRDTDPGAQRLQVSVWVNNTNVARNPGVPDIQRWSQPINLAANAYLRSVAGTNASVRLAGVRDMPKAATRLSLDFSSLLGPLFMMWFFQLLLPIFIYTLVYEKEHHLRIMQRMQGLREAAYYAANYVWMVVMYVMFALVFVVVGSSIGLKIFTLNSYGVQAVLYLLWGNLLASFSFYLSAWQREARSAVLLAVIYVIISGFVANLVLVQYIEQGPTLVADLMQLLPAFSLFRGLYELAQYSFLADRNGGQGLTFAKLSDPGCGMRAVWITMVVQWLVFPLLAFYREQVTGTGTGVKRHRLFFLGVRHPAEGLGLDDEDGSSKKQKKSRWWWPRRRSVVAPEDKFNDSPPKGGDSLDSASAEDVHSPLDYYYGSSGLSAAAPSPHLSTECISTRISEAAPVPRKLSATDILAKAVATVGRKISSVRVNLGNHAGPHAAAPSAGTAESTDVAAERARVDLMWRRWAANPSQPCPSAIMLHNLRKVYPAQKGSGTAEPKVAVRNLSLAIDRNECFGLLGPNGAGKTTTIRMMEGFLDPSSGSAVIEGLSIPADMDSIYSLMGACPQHDLLWEGLTGREHLLFYGRLKGLSGDPLRRAVDDGLRSVNLFAVGNNLVSTYSGGMKRRLSVAIALMGDPKVVYLDEPSTGLDPSSRRLLWEVIKSARRNNVAVVLTTHSMEEAEALCDRLGIFVNGSLQCVGNPKDLTARFGSYLSFTITTPHHQEAAAAAVVRSMAPGARLVYALSGTQKYELPLVEVEVDGVFRRMEEVKLRKELEVLDWGVSNATLEEVFIKITRDAGVAMAAWTG